MCRGFRGRCKRCSVLGVSRSIRDAPGIEELSDEAEDAGDRWKKLEIPVFNGGDDAYGWIQKLERFFRIRKASEADKMQAVIVALDGAALSWYQWWETCNTDCDWEGFKKAVIERFQPSTVQDPFSALLRLNQGGTVGEYVQEFEKHAAAIKGLSEDYLMFVFYHGLKDEIEAELRLYEPTTLAAMMRKARLIEDKRWKIGAEQRVTAAGVVDSRRKGVTTLTNLFPVINLFLLVVLATLVASLGPLKRALQALFLTPVGKPLV